MSLHRILRPTFAAALVSAVVLVAGCTASPGPSPAPTATATPRPTSAGTPTAPPSPSPTQAPTTAPAPAAAYDLEAAYASCVELSASAVKGMTGTFAPFDPADTNPIADETITTDVSDDPNALMMHVHWMSDTGDLDIAVFCSISDPFDAPAIVVERSSSNA
ncbi:hypothetical protein [Herbiconiux sp. YIM B11900]|uniref:hypothetical protein n=1 Tax=Herbiconiux sp. YIM B11900 TaxID=3404131 RepID=UPI003F86FD85